jgi:hypothetical protein
MIDRGLSDHLLIASVHSSDIRDDQVAGSIELPTNPALYAGYAQLRTTAHPCKV